MPIDLVELSGTHREMGLAHGEMFREEAREFCEIRISRALEGLAKGGASVAREDILAFAAEHLPFHEEYHPEGWEEFSGIAEGAGLDHEVLFVGNGLTDFIDAARVRFAGAGGGGGEAEGCTAFIAAGTATPDGESWFGQTWDMHPEAEPFVRAFRRRPAGGPATLTVTTTGCLSLVGISEAGIGAGNNNLRAVDARPGVMYLAIIHRMLASPSFDEAMEAVISAHRCSGHNYACAGPGGRAVFIETTAARYEVLGAGDGVAVHANHYRAERLAEVSFGEAGESSLSREERMDELLEGGVDMETVAAAFTDTEPDAERCICRNAGQASRTCATVLGRPGSGELYATRGSLADGEWTCLKL